MDLLSERKRESHATLFRGFLTARHVRAGLVPAVYSILRVDKGLTIWRPPNAKYALGVDNRKPGALATPSATMNSFRHAGYTRHVDWNCCSYRCRPLVGGLREGASGHGSDAADRQAAFIFVGRKQEVVARDAKCAVGRGK